MEKKVYQINEIKSKLYPVFEASPVYRAILFGSYAKGNATSQSDVDIVIDSKGELLNMAFYGVLEDITEQLNKRIDLFEISEVKRNAVICSAIEREGIVIYGK
ncbi:nucleotidyltransferase family protein [Dehalobacterium formicoaceticum]|uniref:Nucleotidyltransferase domain-containing protein n=1 Tax=Dehalobacterium formicoaceticum TaxID=51515 RepID=A0ABT1Y030_9FIRM|nr:nucleotidyltransferase domain-containing protein [Dehalobacterium formicoaceticum]MCR6544228.1 nucleotidyltransferase domain-containing protein [Dehalobacterium formicoaceticum]